MSGAAGELQPRAQQTPDHEVAVIGAGQAGLTMGYYLAQGRRFVILERSDSVASAQPNPFQLYSGLELQDLKAGGGSRR
jgi:cation diffusion facilitator CzcD-associated flavoprotein CzcO